MKISYLAVLLLITLPRPIASQTRQTAQTPFWDAAISGDTVALAAALEAGAPVDGSLEAARVLLVTGADPKHANREGMTPAGRARQEGFTVLADMIEAAEHGVRPKND